jgi:hypothetical protein
VDSDALIDGEKSLVSVLLRQFYFSKDLELNMLSLKLLMMCFNQRYSVTKSLKQLLVLTDK